MTHTINAKGLACPLPVIEAKKALKKSDSVTVIVDNDIAIQNLKKLAQQSGYFSQENVLLDEAYSVFISRNKEELIPEAVKIAESTTSNEYLVVLQADTMGKGEDALGRTLLSGFVYALKEQDVLPSKIICYNSGVKLTSASHPASQDLIALSEAGVDIFACGACLNYYELTTSLAVGEITNMYHITEMLRTAQRVVQP